MSEKYIVFGATGSIGSSLAEQLVSSGNNVHLVARNEAELKNISDKLGCTSTCLLYTSPSPRDLSTSRMPSSA